MAFALIGGNLDTSVTINSVKATDRNNEQSLIIAPGGLGNLEYSGVIADGHCDICVEYTRSGSTLEQHKTTTVKAWDIKVVHFLNLP